MSCGIYGFLHIPTGKWYIGQSIDIERREKEHRSSIENDWHQLLLKEPNNFHFTILEECSPELLNVREAYYIKTYNSYDNGFNSTRGNNFDENSNNNNNNINKSILLSEWRGYTITDEDENRILRAIQTESFQNLIKKILIELETPYDDIKYDLAWKFDTNYFLIKMFPFKYNKGCKLDDAIFIYLNLEKNITREKQDSLFKQIPKNLYNYMYNIDFYNGPYHNYFYIFNRYGYKCNAYFRLLSWHYDWSKSTEVINDIQPKYVNF